MEKFVNKMLHTEFERYATADLNRLQPGSDNTVDRVREFVNQVLVLCHTSISKITFYLQDKLISIISGLLRQKHFQFIDTYKEEAMTTVRAMTKQLVIEALADSDCCSDQQAAALEVGGLSLNERLRLLDNAINSLTSLLYRIKVRRIISINTRITSPKKIILKLFLCIVINVS